MQTRLSLASSLNLTYLDELAGEVGTESRDIWPLKYAIKNSKALSFLKQNGYTFVVFSSGSPITELKSADIYMSRVQALNAFERVLIGTTPLPMLLKISSIYDQHNVHRQRVLYAFEGLADTTKLKGPIFVFSHILSPHQPFLFGENGQPVGDEKVYKIWNPEWVKRNRDEYIEGYTKQLSFINKKLKETIVKILSDSSVPPIIILQGDHGPACYLEYESSDNTNLKERMSIFNAYYLPNNSQKELYDEITPVNTFRIVFNNYFGTNLELLDDKNYFSTWKRPYKFIDVTDEIKPDTDTSASE